MDAGGDIRQQVRFVAVASLAPVLVSAVIEYVLLQSVQLGVTYRYSLFIPNGWSKRLPDLSAISLKNFICLKQR